MGKQMILSGNWYKKSKLIVKEVKKLERQADGKTSALNFFKTIVPEPWPKTDGANW